MTAWLDWTFFLIVLFPVSLAIAAGSVRTTWVFSAPARPSFRTIERGSAVALAGICAIGTLTSFAAWWIGFDYTESPSGVPARLERIMNAGWVVGVTALVAVILLALLCYIGYALRTSGQRSGMVPTR